MVAEVGVLNERHQQEVGSVKQQLQELKEREGRLE